MRKLSKIGLCFFSWTILVLLTACGEKGLGEDDILEYVQNTSRITWGVKADTPLFGFLDIETRQIQGFEIDLATAITEEILGEEGVAEFVEVSSKTRVPLLKNGNIDAILATMTITEPRLEIVDFSDVYFEAGQSLLVHKDSGITSIEDLDENSVVMTAKGSSSVANIRGIIPNITVLELENFSESFIALKAGQGDAVTTDNSVLYGLASQDSDYIVLDETFTYEPYGIAVNKGQDNFVGAINEALETLQANGVYDELYDKWIGSIMSNNR